MFDYLPSAIARNLRFPSSEACAAFPAASISAASFALIAASLTTGEPPLNLILSRCSSRYVASSSIAGSMDLIAHRSVASLRAKTAVNASRRRFSLDETQANEAAKRNICRPQYICVEGLCPGLRYLLVLPVADQVIDDGWIRQSRGVPKIAELIFRDFAEDSSHNLAGARLWKTRRELDQIG